MSCNILLFLFVEEQLLKKCNVASLTNSTQEIFFIWPLWYKKKNKSLASKLVVWRIYDLHVLSFETGTNMYDIKCTYLKSERFRYWRNDRTGLICKKHSRLSFSFPFNNNWFVIKSWSKKIKKINQFQCSIPSPKTPRGSEGGEIGTNTHAWAIWRRSISWYSRSVEGFWFWLFSLTWCILFLLPNQVFLTSMAVFNMGS